jgi:hypothetical protein
MVHAGLRPRRRRAVIRFGPLGALRGALGLSLWRDRVALGLLAASVLGVLALAGYVYAWMPSLPPFLPLHYNGVGGVDLIGPRTDLYKMPAIGAVVFLADVIVAAIFHRDERFAAYTLLAASVLVQVMLIVATLNIIRLAFGD